MTGLFNIYIENIYDCIIIIIFKFIGKKAN